MDHLPFPKLFEPITIGKVKVKNRIAMLPMGTAYALVSGEVSQKTIDYFGERAKGGTGLIIVGNITPVRPGNVGQLCLNTDWFTGGHFDLVEKLQSYGAKVVAQLNHMGRQQFPGLGLEDQRVSSSAVPVSWQGKLLPPPKALTQPEIYRIIEQLAAAASRAKEVGYDMIELHGAHGYLINQFISPLVNKRTDEFGGSLENRMRFPLEVIKAVRQTVGSDYPVGFRLVATEFEAGGITPEDSPIIARMLEKAGVAYISVTCGDWLHWDIMCDLMRYPEGWKEYLWGPIKKAVKVPVIAGGSLRHPGFCERVLEEGKADLIGLGRPLIADPEWPKKAREGRADDIRWCISCNECLSGSPARRRSEGSRHCAINAAAGRERDFAELRPAPTTKRVMVIGGGPAGMEAARIAALRGHEVTLYEKKKMLGGQVLLAGVPQHKKRVLWLLEYLTNQLKRLNVKVELGVTVTLGLVAETKPDVVVVATGAAPFIPNIPGVGDEKVVSAWDLLEGKRQPGKGQVVVVGGGVVGGEVAEHLLDSGNIVTIVEQLPTIAADMEPYHRLKMLQILEEKSVPMLPSRKVVEITGTGIKVINLETGQEESIKADWVVMAVGAKPVDGLIADLTGKVPELYSAGDCNKPRVIFEAIYEGSLVGRQI